MFVILLNYLPWIILAVMAFFAFKVRNAEKNRAKKLLTVIAVGLLALLVTNITLTRYTPAADTSVAAMEAPAFETVEAPLKNELSTANPNNEKVLAEGTDWRKEVKANKEAVKE